MPASLAATRADEATDADIGRLRTAFPEHEVVPVSVLDPDSLDALRNAIWRMTGLIRVYLRANGSVDSEPLAPDVDPWLG